MFPFCNYPTFVCLQPKGHVPQAQLSPTSDEYILDLLGTCEQKLLKLMDDLGGKDINDVMKEMEDAEVMLNLLGYGRLFGHHLVGRNVICSTGMEFSNDFDLTNSAQPRYLSYLRSEKFGFKFSFFSRFSRLVFL